MLAYDLNKKAIKKTKTKAHLPDLPWMEVIYHHQTKGALHKCIISRANWPEELKKFGGKPLCTSALKRKRRGLEDAGFVRSLRERGQRKSLSIWLTDDGVKELQRLRKFNQKVQQKRSLEDLKNAPSKCEKRPLESEKTPPPLIHANYVNNDHEEDQRLCVNLLVTLGLYESYATKIYNKYGSLKINFAMEQIRNRKVKNKGAYLVKFLSSYKFGGDENFREFEKKQDNLESGKGFKTLSAYLEDKVLNANTSEEAKEAADLCQGMNAILKRIN